MASVTNQRTVESGSDGNVSSRTATNTQRQTTAQHQTTTQDAATDVTSAQGSQISPDDYAFTVSFSIKLREAIPCDEISAD